MKMEIISSLRISQLIEIVSEDLGSKFLPIYPKSIPVPSLLGCSQGQDYFAKMRM